MENQRRADNVTSEFLGIRVRPESLQLATGDGTIHLHCPNQIEYFEKIEELIRELSISLVTVVANNDLERPLVEWLRDRGVQTVVVHFPASQPSLVDQFVTVSKGVEAVKMIYTGIVAVMGGLFIMSLGIEADQNGDPIVPGGIWKGSVIILLGIALLAIYARKSIREANATQ